MTTTNTLEMLQGSIKKVSIEVHDGFKPIASIQIVTDNFDLATKFEPAVKRFINQFFKEK